MRNLYKSFTTKWNINKDLNKEFYQNAISPFVYVLSKYDALILI